jgi:type IV pilus biogenesis protein PilP
MAPDGHLVYLGKPSLVPPVRPEQEKADEPVIETAKSLLASSGTPLINLRPRSRPDATIATDQAQAENDALRLLRPREKPVSLEDRIQETLASLEQDSADTGLNEVLKPKARPKNLDTARKTAVITPEEEGDEAAPPTNAAPKIPSNAKVSKEATIKNALKLNKLNLLGVYGTGSKKRALVRFSNGRRQMVSVGDKLDGGKVAAIGDTELRYVKSGQNVVLKLPKG